MNKLFISLIIMLTFGFSASNTFAEVEVSPLSSVTNAPSCENQIQVAVDGLVCDFCARALEKVFGKRDDVNAIQVDLNQGKVLIDTLPESNLDDTTITRLITDSGYNLVAIDKGCS